jgi:hypothetical protein
MKTTIQTLRKYAKNPQSLDVGSNDGTPFIYYFGALLPEDFSHEIIRLNHTGWFTNAEGCSYKDGSGLARGLVVSLPASPGFPEGRFLAGYYWGDNDERVLYLDLYRDKDEAARDADGYAESFAEDQREHDEKWQRARELEDEISEKSREICKLFEIRHITGKHWAEHPREILRETIAEIREMRETLRKDFADVI